MVFKAKVARHVRILISFFVLTYYASLRSGYRVVVSVVVSSWKLCSVRLCLRLFVGGLVSYLHYLCFFAFYGVPRIF